MIMASESESESASASSTNQSQSPAPAPAPFNLSTSHSPSRHASPQPQPQPQPELDHYVSYEEMILRALTHAEDHWPSSPTGKPFPGAPPKHVFAYMARHYAHLLPANFKGSATQALKKAVKKGLVVHLYRAYALNHDYAGAVAPGRVKPNVWTNKLKVEVADTPKARQKSKRTRRRDQQVAPSSSEDRESTFRSLTPHSPLRLPDPIHFLSSSAASSAASPMSMPDARSAPSATFTSSSASSSNDNHNHNHNDNDDTDLAAQILMTFTTPPPPPTAAAGAGAPSSTTPRPLRPRPPALPLAATHTTIPDFGIPTPGIDSTSFAASRAPVPPAIDVPGSCVRPPTSPLLFPSAPASAASTRCSSAAYGSGLDLDTTCTAPHVVLPRPTRVPMGAGARSAADIVDSILFPCRPSAAAAPAVSEFDAAHAPYPLKLATSGYPFAAPPAPAPAPTLAHARHPQGAPPQVHQHVSLPVAWLPVRLGPNGQLILPEGWSFIKPTAAAAAGAAPVHVHVNGVGMIDERASSESSSYGYGSTSGAGTPVARWWEAGGGGAGERSGMVGPRPGGMGM